MPVALRLLVVLLLAGLPAAAGAADPVAGSRGQWSGSVTERTPGPALPADRVTLRIDGAADRFSVHLAGPAGALLAGEFQAGARKDVYGPPAARGLMSFLGRGSAVNPVEGKPLAWARRDGDGLVVYRLDLGAGAHRLDRLTVAPEGTRLAIAFERREHDRAVERFRATLERSGP
ncbi:MAG: hypothetical protein BroJett026_00310 [Betaproteobacteria bacterium]|nr:MAG: hypothetical protein BroJett026_00310 [Betaproteobacteria bacterium]